MPFLAAAMAKNGHQTANRGLLKSLASAILSSK